MGTLEQRLASLQAQAEERGRNRPTKPAKIIQLPLWSESNRGVPNSALRGALFAAIQGKDRQALKEELLATQQGMEIRFTGWQLDQSDLEVWEQALHLACQHPLGDRCNFTLRGFLKALGRSYGSSQRESVINSLNMLTACAVHIRHDHYVYTGSLIEAHARDEITNFHYVRLNPDIIKLYYAGWTAINWQQRKVLKRKPLAQWLHSYYASHANPYPVSVEKLRQLSGSRNANLRDFKQQLRKALQALQDIGVILKFEIKDGLVFVEKVPTVSQQKHLKRATPHK